MVSKIGQNVITFAILFKSWLKVAIRNTDNSILVEGNIDVIICTWFRHENVLKFGRNFF